MGAAEFFVVRSGPTAKAAFEAAVRSAQHENGHGGYTGTIAEKVSSGFVMIAGKREGLPTLEEARALAKRLIADGDPRIDDKWGPAGCIALEGGRAGSLDFLFFGWASE